MMNLLQLELHQSFYALDMSVLVYSCNNEALQQPFLGCVIMNLSPRLLGAVILQLSRQFRRDNGTSTPK